MKRRALTLAEIIIALGLFSLIALAVMSILLSARSASSAGAESATAAAVAQGQLDSLATLPNATLLGYLTAAPPDYPVVQDGRTYQVHVQVARLNTAPGAVDYNLLDVSVRLTWQQLQSFGQRSPASQVARSLVQHTVVSSLVNY